MTNKAQCSPPGDMQIPLTSVLFKMACMTPYRQKGSALSLKVLRELGPPAGLWGRRSSATWSSPDSGGREFPVSPIFLMKTLRPHVGTEIKSIVFIHFLLSYTILTMTLEVGGRSYCAHFRNEEEETDSSEVTRAGPLGRERERGHHGL